MTQATTIVVGLAPAVALALVGVAAGVAAGYAYDDNLESVVMSNEQQNFKNSWLATFLDGYISGATVFADAMGSGVLAAGDVSTTTDANGNFTLTGGTGPLVAFGGTDISTGLPFQGTLEAPAGSSVTDPLTTLVAGLQAANGLSLAAAQQAVLAAFGLSTNLDLTTLDPIAGTQSGDPASAAAYIADSKVIDTADMIASAFGGAGVSFANSFAAAFSALENAVNALPSGQTLNLSDQGTITALVKNVAATEGINASFLVTAVAAAIAASNAGLDQKLAQDGATAGLITDGSSAQLTAQSTTSTNLASIVSTALGRPAPVITSLSETPVSGDLGIGATVTLTLTSSEAVTVTGTPMLSLNDGGAATYDAVSSTPTSLVFDYTVGASDSNLASLAGTSINLNGGFISDASGNAANLSLAEVTQTGPQIDTVTPTITSVIETPSSGDLGVGATVAITLTTSEPLTNITGGYGTTLSLNDGCIATYDTAASSSSSFVFDYTVAAGQNTSSLAVTEVNLNGVVAENASGNPVNTSLAGLTQAGPVIDTVDPSITAITESPATGDLGVGASVAITLTTSEPLTNITGGYGTTLSLNDGGIATFDPAASTSSSFVFDYTVAAGQNTSSLAVTGVNLNGVTAKDAAGNSINTSLAGLTQAGPQINTIASSATLLANYMASSFVASSDGHGGTLITDPSASQQALLAQPHA